MTTLHEFLGARLRDKGISLKKLSEMTGIAPIHLENLLHGNFENMPSTPYFRGYLIRIGKVLDFDGMEWWEKIKKEEFAQHSGPSDALPHNRFMKKEISKSAWAIGIVALLAIVYIAINFSHISGKPTLTVTFPPASPFITTSTSIIIQGTAKNADALYVVNPGASSSEILLSSDGSWQKEVFLGNGPNSFEISAKKFLGGETVLTEEIIYVPAATTSTSSSSYPAIHFSSTTPATGTYFN